MRGQRNWGTVNVEQLQQDLFGARQDPVNETGELSTWYNYNKTCLERGKDPVNEAGELSRWYNKTCSARGKDPDLVRRSDKNFIVDRSMNVKSTFH
jgi:hypothetical protein